PAALAWHLSTCRTRSVIPPAPGKTVRTGSAAHPSGRRSRRPPLPPHRVLHPEGHAALEDITLHRQLGVFPPQPGQLRPLVLIQRAVAFTAAPLVGVHPIT